MGSTDIWGLFYNCCFFSDGTWGVLTYGDCAAGSSFHIWIVDGRIEVSIELIKNGVLSDYILDGGPVSENTTDICKTSSNYLIKRH